MRGSPAQPAVPLLDVAGLTAGYGRVQVLDGVDVAVAGMLTLLEPIMIAFLGTVVGGIVIAMYMPIFDMISKLT